MRAVFVVGGLDVYVEASGERRFFLSGISRTGTIRCPLGVARWEPQQAEFELHLTGGEAYFPSGTMLMQVLVDKLDAVRDWYLAHQAPDPRLGILFSDNTAPHEAHTSLPPGEQR